MKIAIATLALALASTSAYAWDAQTAGHGPQAIGQDSGSAAAAQANAAARARAQAQQAQGQGQSTNVSGVGGGSASNQGNNQTVNVGGGGHNNFPVASAIAPSIMTVNPCSGGAVSGGIQLFGVGASGAGSIHFDQMCQIAMYSSNPYAFQWACTQMDGFRDAARDAFRAHFAPHPCAQDVTLEVALPSPAPPIPPAVIEPPPVKRWAVVPCHVPGYRDAAGRCHYPAPKPKPVVTIQPMTCHDLIIETLRECREERR